MKWVIKNIKRIITRHNLKILNYNDNKQNDRFNCRDWDRCPLKGNYLLSNVLYKAIVGNYTNSFRLSKYICQIKGEMGKSPIINLDIENKAQAYKEGNNSSWLCLEEKSMDPRIC